MGVAYVLWVYDDAVQGAQRDADQRWKYKLELGEAVLELCKSHMSRRSDVRSFRVRNHSNAINRAGQGEVNSPQVFLWANNCLRPTYELNVSDLEFAKRLIHDQIAQLSSRTE